ncbi:hypothetical protein OESDEN_24383, partial [Oesophagostomum dentatum]
NGSANEYEEAYNCHLAQWYPGQDAIEAILVLIAILCVPVMLFGKPIKFVLEQKKKRKTMGSNISVRANVVADDSEIIINGSKKKEEAPAAGGGHHEEEGFGDVMVHQAIHTIEYVLGCVSHTASYLRLWALSLAHAQLSEVLWHMVLANAFAADGIFGYIILYVIFLFFAILTFSILVLMEGLSAFLHALR